MQKIPTLFIRDPNNPKRVTREVDPECVWVLDGEGVATEKYDGSACAVIGSVLYRRHQHKSDKGEPPESWLHWTLSPEQRSGHGWLPCRPGDPSCRYHLEAWELCGDRIPGGTYELVGPKSNGNPHGLERHELWRHGHPLDHAIDATTFDGILDYLSCFEMEGIVWHHPDGRMAKIKRRDFGLPWPVKR